MLGRCFDILVQGARLCVYLAAWFVDSVYTVSVVYGGYLDRSEDNDHGLA
jgi:hypothetical protein